MAKRQLDVATGVKRDFFQKNGVYIIEKPPGALAQRSKACPIRESDRLTLVAGGVLARGEGARTFQTTAPAASNNNISNNSPLPTLPSLVNKGSVQHTPRCLQFKGETLQFPLPLVLSLAAVSVRSGKSPYQHSEVVSMAA